jgi:hypothetical protein
MNALCPGFVSSVSHFFMLKEHFLQPFYAELLYAAVIFDNRL